ncbi:MAG TPA: restriction endonuclease subunit R [Ruminococcaceae bacterium]|nr:restriction endonuclease subunit R [Oscillospiraceae bacterium]
MVTISAKTKDRIILGMKKFQPIMRKAQAADINESDTVTIITDMLCELFGYDKYENITSEFAIKKTYCDLAIKMDGKVPLLLECKAAGIDLKDDHVRQATNYAADSGIEWVVLTNGVEWRVFKIVFSKPVEKQLVYNFNFCEMSTKKQTDIEMLYFLSIEAFTKSSKTSLEDLYAQKKVFNKYTITQVMLTENYIDYLRKSIKKLYPDVKIESSELYSLLLNEIFKRDVIEGDAALSAKKDVQRAEKKMMQSKPKKDTTVKTETNNKEQ